MATVLQWPRTGDGSDLLTDGVQQQLACWNRERLSPRLPPENWRLSMERDQQMLGLEAEFIQSLREQAREEAAEAPSDADGFVRWFEGLKQTGPGQNDPLFP